MDENKSIFETHIVFAMGQPHRDTNEENSISPDQEMENDISGNERLYDEKQGNSFSEAWRWQ